MLQSIKQRRLNFLTGSLSHSEGCFKPIKIVSERDTLTIFCSGCFSKGLFMRLQFSQELRLLLEKERVQPLTLADMLVETSERGFLLIIGLLALPFLFPMPPGVSTVLGSACLFLSVQMALGQRTPWLPHRIAAFHFPQILVVQLIKNLGRVAKVIEKITQPRWSRFSQNASVWRINGICLLWLTLLLMLPIPFTNPIPATGMLLLAISTLEKDGLLMFLGYFVVGLNTALFGAIAYLLWRSPNIVQQFL